MPREPKLQLESISAAVERGDHVTALQRAVEAWRDRRTAVLAELVDVLAAQVPAPAIAGRDKAGFQKGYLALATSKDPGAPTTLASGLAQRVPIRETGYWAKERDRKRHAHFLARVAALADRDPDPRVAHALAGAIVKAPFSVDDGAAVYRPVIELAVVLGDERVAAMFEEVLARPVAKTKTLRDYFAKTLPAALGKLRRRATVATPELDRLLATLRRPAASVRPAVDALLAECLATPDDDAPRLVYADALLEAGDPRGELIQLQLRAEQAPLSDADAKQMASIVRKHEKAWLGDITRVTKLRGFRRGFLDRCELLQGAAADPETWKAIAADPRLATVRTLEKGSASEELYRSFVFSPALRSLRRVTVPSVAMLGALETIDRRLESITLSSLTPPARALLDRVGPATGLASVAFHTSHPPRRVIEDLLGWPGRTIFDELIAIPHHRVSAAWVEDELEWLFAFERLGVARLGIERGPYENRVVLTRTKTGVTADIVANQDPWIVRLLTRALPLRLEHLVIRGNPSVWFPPGKDFDAAIAKLPARAVELRERWRRRE